jgi:hypothetical protein
MASTATQPPPQTQDNSKKRKLIVAVSARRAAAFAVERDRLNNEAADVARAALARKQKKQKNRAPQEAPQQEEQEEQEARDRELAAFVRAHACARAVYEGVLPRPLPCEDDDDDATAAAREDAYDAHEAARARERARICGALRRLRAAYARRALPRLHALRREAHALARLGERLRADAARVAGADHRDRGYRADLERMGDLEDQGERYDLYETGEPVPGFADLLRAADAHTLEAERLVARARALAIARGGGGADRKEDEERRLLRRRPALTFAYDAEATKQQLAEDEDAAHLLPLPGESDLDANNAESDMSEADEEEEDKKDEDA